MTSSNSFAISFYVGLGFLRVRWSVAESACYLILTRVATLVMMN